MSRGKVLKPLLGGLIAMVAAACGSVAAGGGSAPSSDKFPLTIGKITIEHRPARIVSLSASATQDLYAVGAGKQVVAVDTYSTYPANAPRTKLSGYQPNVEAIAGYRPDLVINTDDTGDLANQLSKLNIAFLIEPPATDLNDAYAQMQEIGKATGHSADAAAAVSTLKQQIQAQIRTVPALHKPLSVYHELDQTYYSATSSTFIGQVYKLLGLRDIADKAPGSNPYPQLSSEYVISANPDLIVLADTDCCQQDAATVGSRPGWSAIAAVKRGAVVAVHDELASQWGPRILLFIQAVVRELKTLQAGGM